jgi:hypothetical protein
MSQPQTRSDDILKTTAEAWGFCMIQGLFSAAEMAEIERCMAQESANFPEGFPDLFSVPSLRWLVTDPRIQGVARRLLGPDPVYYRLTNIAYEAEPGPLTEKPYVEFHCDARGMPDSLNSSDHSPPTDIYPAYRFAIYCRDYSRYSGGLKVAVGSHMMPFVDLRQYTFPQFVKTLPKVRVTAGDLFFDYIDTPFKLHNVASAPGDLVVFNLRTFHSAGALRFRDQQNLAVLPVYEGPLRRATHLAEHYMPRAPGSRNAIFFDFARASPQADLYIKWAASRFAGDGSSLTPVHTGAADGIIVRNDISMVNHACYLRRQCAARGIDLLAAVPSWPLPAPLDTVAERLLSLCATHREFSPHHTLLDADGYAAAARQGPAQALSYAVKSITALLEYAAEDMARLKAEAQAELGT